ncbi:MarR family transcriptional regulator [Sediminicoccus sp. KRV36]|uniref:MarR family winged helix-turn-helix transcriptional regulator n=1 Tax=Sediminicoccus sp. KRV36 TaxID=3133721 RepID=UPI00200E87BB|nr:MarR family transcriptional regulator [Sediminicoccus rosea]UPY36897.1 MarR family transcriptional regulator [Sediminicoccus rosea]
MTRKSERISFLVNFISFPMATNPSALTAHLGYWLRQVSNHVSQSFARKLAARDVTVAEWAVMRMLLDRVPPSPSQLAEEMGMTRGAITKLADRLLAKGLIGRRASHADGRSHTLHLTAQGADLVPDLAALADANEAECFAHLPEADRATLRRILEETVHRLGLTATPIN